MTRFISEGNAYVVSRLEKNEPKPTRAQFVNLFKTFEEEDPERDSENEEPLPQDATIWERYEADFRAAHTRGDKSAMAEIAAQAAGRARAMSRLPSEYRPDYSRSYLADSFGVMTWLAMMAEGSREERDSTIHYGPLRFSTPANRPTRETHPQSLSDLLDELQ